MLSDHQRQTLNEFLKSHPVAVIATADTKGTPAAAVVLFAHDEDMTIVFATHQTRKYRNLKTNPMASLVFSKDWMQVQMFGEANELTGAEAKQAPEAFAAKHPEMDKHLVEGSVFFRFRPAWARYMNTATHPPIQWESVL